MQHEKECYADDMNTIEVAGLVALRTNQKTGAREVLLVRGIDDQWYFPGGQREVQDESMYDTLTREIFEELGLHYEQHAKEVSTKSYQIGDDTYLIHTFLSPEELDTGHASTEDDEVVSAFVWTATPFVERDGTERILTEHAREVLLQYFPAP